MSGNSSYGSTIDCLKEVALNSSITREHNPNAATMVLRSLKTTPPASSTITSLPRIPHRLGNYEIRRELGRGGMGIVYEGFDPLLRRTVAVKVLKDSSDAEFLQRFRTEAEAVAQLQHPNIVHVFEVGWEDGVPFVVLEYLSGGSLHQRIGGKPKSPQIAAERVRDLAAAAAHAHLHGVVHRDLKPANILFTEQDQPKITDFGAARLLPMNGETNDPGLTRMGEVIGTPQYMAPEQASGSQQDVGPAADIYSLGAILYEMLTGRPPFTGVDPFDILQAVRTQEPLSPRKLQPKIPRDIEIICLKCLEKEPHRRYASATDLFHDLVRYLAGDAILARPPGTIRRYWLRARRRPAVAGMTVGLILAGVLGMLAFGWQFTKTLTALDRAQTNETKALQKSQEADAASQETEKQRVKAEGNLKKNNSNLYQSTIAQSQHFSSQGKLNIALNVLQEAPDLLRNWEWYHQRRITSDVLWKYEMRDYHPDDGVCWVQHLELSPDGKRIACAFHNPYEGEHQNPELNPGHIGIFNVEDGKMLKWMPRAMSRMILVMKWVDDQTIIISNQNGSMRTIDTATGRTVAEWPVADLDHAWVSSNSKGTFVIRIVKDDMKILELIDPLRRQPTRRIQLRCPDNEPRSITHDGRLATYTEREKSDYRHVVLDLETNQIVMELSGNFSPPVFTSDRRYMVTTAGKEFVERPNRWRNHTQQDWQAFPSTPGIRSTCKVTVWDTKTWTPVWSRNHLSHVLGGIHLSPDDSRIAVHNTDVQSIVCYDTATGDETISMRGHVASIRNIRFSPDGQFLLTCSDDKTVRVWNVLTGHQIVQHHGHVHSVRQALFSNDGRRIISGGADEVLDCLDLSRPISNGGIMPPHESGGEGTSFGAIHFQPDGRLSVLNTQSGITVFDPSTGNPITVQKLERLTNRHAKELMEFSFSKDGSLVSGRLHGRVIRVKAKDSNAMIDRVLDTDIAIWNTVSGQIIRAIETEFGRLHTTTLSPDGQLVIATGLVPENKKFTPAIIGWDVKTGHKRFRILPDALCSSIAFSPDGSEFAAGMNRPLSMPGPTILIFSMAGVHIEEVKQFPSIDSTLGKLAFVNALSYSSDGQKLGGINWAIGSVFLLDRQSKELLWTGSGNSPLTSMAFSPDDKRIVTTGYDDIVHIYDVESGSEVASMNGSTGRIDDYAFPGQIRFSADGRTLAATHWNGHFSMWHVDSMNPEPISPTRLRDLADQAAFRFHLYSAYEALRRNDAFAFRVQTAHLSDDKAPTDILRQQWNNLKGRVVPKKIIGALAGGWATE